MSENDNDLSIFFSTVFNDFTPFDKNMYKIYNQLMKTISNFIKVLFAFCSIFLAFSCASSKNLQPALSPVYVTNTKKVNLLPPADASISIDSVYSLTMSFGKDSFSVLAYAQLDNTGITMTLLNDFGTDMGVMIYNGESVIFDSPLLPDNLKPEYIICDIQNIYYDLEKLQANYKKVGLSFEETELDSKKVRLLKNGSKVIEEIVFEGNTVKLKNLLRGYEYILVQAE